MTGNNLYEELGGKPTFEALVDYFYAQVLLDFELKPFFENIDMKRLRDHQVQFLAAIAGGPAKREVDMAKAHKGRGINEAAFNRVAGHLVKAMEHFKVPEHAKSQLLDAVLGYKDQVIQDGGK
ncbi:MAG: group 1 truncated hemoglobin [bacterium]|nr:group 1 truncated hemoglobin [bacterium]